MEYTALGSYFWPMRGCRRMEMGCTGCVEEHDAYDVGYCDDSRSRTT
jgi:hypothetical protein